MSDRLDRAIDRGVRELLDAGPSDLRGRVMARIAASRVAPPAPWTMTRSALAGITLILLFAALVFRPRAADAPQTAGMSAVGRTTTAPAAAVPVHAAAPASQGAESAAAPPVARSFARIRRMPVPAAEAFPPAIEPLAAPEAIAPDRIELTSLHVAALEVEPLRIDRMTEPVPEEGGENDHDE